MIEKSIGLEKLSILQCQQLAKTIGYNTATFDLCGPKGKLKAKWLDAYMGIFQIGEESGGFNMVSQFQYLPDIYCTNLQVE